MIILDASVAVKWFHQEADTHAALKYLEVITTEKERAIVPDLLFFELANTLVLKKTESERVREALETMFALPWQRAWTSKELISAAAEVAGTAGITVYDAVYVVLARNYRGTLVTADRKLYRVIGKPLVRLLE